MPGVGDKSEALDPQVLSLLALLHTPTKKLLHPQKKESEALDPQVLSLGFSLLALLHTQKKSEALDPQVFGFTCFTRTKKVQQLNQLKLRILTHADVC